MSWYDDWWEMMFVERKYVILKQLKSALSLLPFDFLTFDNCDRIARDVFGCYTKQGIPTATSAYFLYTILSAGLCYDEAICCLRQVNDGILPLIQKHVLHMLNEREAKNPKVIA